MFAVLDDEDSSSEDGSASPRRQERIHRRLEEYIALEAIFAEACWKASSTDAQEREPIFLRVGPRRWTASCAAPWVVLKAERPEGYPDLAALGPIEVQAAEGSAVPGRALGALRKALTARAATLVGEVALHDLAELASDQLEALEAAALPLNERMVAREERERALDEARDAELARTRAALDDEGARRAAEALESEARRLTTEAVVASDEGSSEEGSSVDTRGAASRYVADFRELGVVGRGASGEVAKAMHRVDRKVYAVKKVRLSGGATRQARRQLREVEALARVFHPHVVRYFQAWIEGWLGDRGEESSEAEEGTSRSSSSSEDVALTNTLYIQMEYCPRTLRQLIDAGALVGRPDDAWRLVRQVIEALAYLHSTCSIVHRDLKPANIFVDAQGNVKVGDLGLATAIAGDDAASCRDEEDDAATKTDENVDLSTTSLTRGVGTALYRAPEVMDGQTKYDSAADLYSLGVAIYEMWHRPFETGMERIERLTQLRLGRGVFDADVDAEAQALVGRLVCDDPAARPTAAALLEGRELGLLPSAADAIDGDSGLLSRAKATIRNPFSRARAHLVDALFDSETTAHSELAFGRPNGAKRATLLDAAPRLRILAGLERTLRHLFEAHGALPAPAPLLRPRLPDHADEPRAKRPCELVDPTGVVVVLPSELTTPFARRAAADSAAHCGLLRRYEISRVFEAATTGPAERPAAAWDAVFFAPSKALAPSLMTLEAECIALAAEVAPPGARLVVGHADLAPALRALCQGDADLGAKRARLLESPPDDPLRCLEALRAALEKVRRGDEKRDAAKRRLRGALDHLDRVLAVSRDCAGLRWRGSGPARTALKGLARALAARLPEKEPTRQPCRLVLDLEALSARPPFGDSGLYFGARDDDRLQGDPCKLSRRTSSIDDHHDPYVCVGGRYDAALARHVAPLDRSKAPTRAVGLRVDIERLEPSETRGATETVLTCASERTDEGDGAALLLAATLRRSGIAAAHLPRSRPAGNRTRKVADEALATSAKTADWVVMLSADGVDRGTATIVDSADGYSVGAPRRQVPLAALAATASVSALFDNDEKPDSSSQPSLAVKLVDCAADDDSVSSTNAGAAGSSRKEFYKKKVDHDNLRRRVVAAFRALLGTAVDLDDRAPALCLAVNAPLGHVRRVATAFLAADLAAAREAAVVDDRAKHKRHLRLFAAALATAFVPGSNAKQLQRRFAYVYAMPDDALDLVFLPAHKASGRAADFADVDRAPLPPFDALAAPAANAADTPPPTRKKKKRAASR